MAKIDAETLERWRGMALEWMAHCVAPPYNGLEHILLGRDAWTVAHRAMIYLDARDNFPDAYDAHIQTALEKIFPNAIFRDKKRY